LKGAGDLPHEKTIREKYVPDLKTEEETAMETALAGKDIVAITISL